MNTKTKWIRVAEVDEVPANGFGHRASVEGLDLALFQWDQTFFAVENLCPHLGFPLTEGILQNGSVICGWHGWRISLRDGSCAGKALSAPTYPCEVRGTDLYVEIPSLPDGTPDADN